MRLCGGQLALHPARTGGERCPLRRGRSRDGCGGAAALAAAHVPGAGHGDSGHLRQGLGYLIYVVLRFFICILLYGFKISSMRYSKADEQI